MCGKNPTNRTSVGIELWGIGVRAHVEGGGRKAEQNKRHVIMAGNKQEVAPVGKAALHGGGVWGLGNGGKVCFLQRACSECLCRHGE